MDDKGRDAHMARRAEHQTQQAVAHEFGRSQPTVHRAVKRSMIRDGYTSAGSAK